ncbi:MAG: hypothetical protein ACLPSW_12340 [Roseiarcus sp.]
MSEDLVVALALLALGVVATLIGGIYAFQQKIYFDPRDNSVTTEISVPFFGKLKTNAPAIGLCFLGAVSGYLAYDLMRKRGPTYVNFEGEVTLDSSVKIPAIIVGLTSGTWVHTETLDGSTSVVNVAIPVPNSWQSYSAYAFALGGPKTKPAIIGASLERPRFKLRIEP